MRKPQDVQPEGVKIIHRVEGRIYGLDLGEAYDDPGGDRVGEKHKHPWDEQTGMKEASLRKMGSAVRINLAEKQINSTY